MDEAIPDVLAGLNGISESLDPAYVEQYLSLCHRMSRFLRGKDEAWFSSCLSTGIVERVGILIISPPSEEVLVGSLELLSGLLACPTPIITSFLLKNHEFISALVNVLNSENVRAVRFTLRSVAMIAKDCSELGIRCFNFFKITDDLMRTLIDRSKMTVELQPALMLACRYMCESQRCGDVAMSLLEYLISVYDPSMHPALLFPLVIQMLKRYPRMVVEYPFFKTFVTVQIHNFIAPSRSLDIKQADSVAIMAIKTFQCYCNAFPDETDSMCRMIPIDDLLEQIQNSFNAKFLSRAMQILTLRLKQENSEWVHKLLFDRHIVQELPKFMEFGSFRLKKSTIALATTLLEHTLGSENAILLANPDFVSCCCDFLFDDSQDIALLAINFLSLACQRVMRGDVQALQSVFEEADVKSRLESFASTDDHLSAAAHVLYLSLEKLFC